MRLKQRSGDFRVQELFDESWLSQRGEHRLYRVRKRKLTSTQAAAVLASAARVEARSIGMAGLKDRQGVTVQYMSTHGGTIAEVDEPDLKIELVGRGEEPYSSSHSRGNAFDLIVRDLDETELEALRANLEPVRLHGLPNYFDDQRFGNLRHEQGWIARELAHGRIEGALEKLLVGPSPFDDERARGFKSALGRAWGDWQACLKISRRFGTHRSVFEALVRAPHDFGGAFARVSGRLRLIHLYAWQSHLWNRALSDFVAGSAPRARLRWLESEDGPLCCPAGEPEGELRGRASFPLAGAGLENVRDPLVRGLYEEVLARERLVPDQLRIEGVPGFALKGEERALCVRPIGLRARPAALDELHPGRKRVALRFELPRGSYATLVVKRLFVRAGSEPRRAPQRARLPRPRGRGVE
jgi:tRNA pseudouridine13 synthase